jgi:hypothetical protein
MNIFIIANENLFNEYIIFRIKIICNVFFNCKKNIAIK